jgi:hypothetical protein
MAATNNRLLISESRGDSNQCTSCRGKPDQHNMYASHASSRTSNVCFLWVVPIRGNLSRDTDRFGQIPLLLRKRAPDTIRGSTPSFTPEPVNEVGGVSQAPIGDQLLGLPGPYHRHVIGTFNTCSRVPTPRSLTDTGGGYHIENLRIATTLSPPLHSEGSTDPPNGPAQSQIIQTTSTNSTRERTSPKSREWEPPLDFYHNLPSTHSMS